MLQYNAMRKYISNIQLPGLLIGIEQRIDYEYSAFKRWYRARNKNG
jgi:hypothetical protein